MTWYNNSWNYRKQITISNTGSTLTDYQVSITIDTATLVTAGKLLSSCNDIRFTSSDGSTLLNYWIESGINTSSTKIWVKIPSIANGNNNTVYLYYNNPSATYVSNGSNTFDLFDDFTYGDIVTNHGWNVITGTAPTPSGSKITLSTNWIYYSTLFGTNYAMRGYGKMSSTGAAQEWGFSTKTTSGASNDIQNAQYSVSMYAHSTGNLYIANYGTGQTQLNGGAYTTTYNVFEIVRNSTTNTQFTHDGTAYNNSPIAANVPSQNMYVHLLGIDAGSSEWDWVLVRKYTSSEPTTCIGGEEVSTIQWLSGWGKRKLTTITGSTSGAQTDYQMKIIVHKATGTDTSTDIYLGTGTNIKDDFSDLRFTSNDGSTLLSYWIESYTSGSVATVWIKIPSIPASPCTTTIYTYYSNPSATSISNGTNTFGLYIDGNDAENWSNSGCGGTSITNVNGELNIYHDTAGGCHAIRSGFSGISYDFVYEDRVKVATVGAGIANYIALTSNSLSDRFVQIGYPTTDSTNIANCNGGCSTEEILYNSEAANTYYRLKANVRISSSKVDYYAYSDNGTLLGSNVNRGYAVGSPTVFNSIYTGTFTANRTSNQTHTWIFARKYVSPEPTTCIGGEEVSTVSWLSGWGKRKLTTITGSTSGAQTDYQMKLIAHKATGTDTSTDIYLGTGTNIKDDFSDLRFTSNDGSTLLSYWIESYTSGSVTTVWIKIPSIPASPCTTTIYTYYSKPDAAAVSNGTNTFNLFDDFLGSSIDATIWDSTGGPTVSGSLITFHRNDTVYQSILSKQTFDPRNYITMTRFELTPYQATNYTSRLGFGWNNSLATDYTYSVAYHTDAGGNNNLFYSHYYTDSVSYTFSDNVFYIATSYMDQSYHVIAKLYDGITITTSTSAGTYSAYNKVYLGLAYVNAQVDWTLVRKYASPEPTFSSTGTEQTAPNITATSMTITPSENPCRVGICTVLVSVTWTNNGGTAGIFTPSIKVDGTPVVVMPALTPVSVNPSDTKTQSFTISSLSVSTHNICPDPN